MSTPSATASLSAKDRIGRAARDLFVERGCTATTIEAIAREAGVECPRSTPCSAPSEILAELRRQWFDEADVVALVSEGLSTTDPHKKLRQCANWVRRQVELRRAITAVIEEATHADPQAAALIAELSRKSEAKICERVDGLDGYLAADLSPDDAVGVIWALT